MLSTEEKKLLVDAAKQSQLDQPQHKLARYLKEEKVTSLHVDWADGAEDLSEDERCDLVYNFLTSPGKDITDEIL